MARRCTICDKTPATYACRQGILCQRCKDLQTEICDFCGGGAVIWSYPCDSFIVGFDREDTTARSVDAWTACTVCHDLIEGQAWESLASRCVEMSPYHGELPPDIHWTMVRELHDMFRAMREGPAERFQKVTPQ